MARQRTSGQRKGPGAKASQAPQGLRVIAGEHRGRRLAVPEGLDLRPTSDRARESLFNILINGYRRPDGTGLLPGARVLDGFAGSGALGIEALSRGAAQVTFAEQSRVALECLRQNTVAFGDQCRIIAGAIEALPQTSAPADLILLDPPYAYMGLPDLLPRLVARGWLAPGTLLVVERDAKAKPDQQNADSAAYAAAGLALLEQRNIGRNAFSFLRRSPDAPSLAR